MQIFSIPLQAILIIFLLFAFSRVVLRFREGKVNFGMLVFWSGIWILASISVLQPDLTTFLAQKAGIGRGADAIIYLSLVLLFYLVYRTNVVIENLRQEITELTRIIALRKEKELNKRKK